jgi:glycosyltransferase involved in cell wall biosynthesis
VASGIRWEVDPDWYSNWIEGRTRELLELESPGPLLSIVMPCHDTPAEFLDATVSSIRAQSYPNWELCIADDGSRNPGTLKVLSRQSEHDRRIRVTRLHRNRGIAAASNAALALASGSLVIPVDHDDLLPRYALATVAAALARAPDAKLFFSDSDRVDAGGVRSRPYFKPAWNYDLFLAQNYLNHLTAVDAELLRSVGGWREGYEGSQDYDLYFRLVEALPRRQIAHIPEVLYHWREHRGSFSQSRLSEAVRAARRALTEHLERTGREATVTAPPGAMIYNHVRWSLPQRRTRLLLVLLGPRSAAMDALLQRGRIAQERLDVEVRAVDEERGLLEGLEAEVATAGHPDLVMLLNAAASELSGTALEELAARSLQTDAGCVGPKCIDPGDALVSAPELLADAQDRDRLYSRRWQSPASATRGYFHHLLLHQETDVLPPDAVMFRYRHLADYGALSDQYASLHLAIADLCLASATLGHSSIWNGALTLRLAGAALPECYSAEDLSRFRKRWRHDGTASRFSGRQIRWITAERD